MTTIDRVLWGRTDACVLEAIALRPRWLERIWERLAGYPAPDECWVWTGYTARMEAPHLHARAMTAAAAHLGITVSQYKRTYGQSKARALAIIGGSDGND